MKQAIRSFLADHRAGGEDDFSDDDSLVALGVMDSLVIVELIAHLEDQYNIHVDNDDIDPENFDSVDAIIQYIERKTHMHA